jgi:mevalonate kinase
MPDQKFYSNGKLMITSEYMVLEGALSLSVPLKIGQSMKVTKTENSLGKIFWSTFVKNKIWFYGIYNQKNLDIIESSNNETAVYIQNILKKAAEINNDIFNQKFSTIIKTDLDFLPNWGFGSSSTLISNIAYWINADPFTLLWKTSNGSGYDIACARENSPIIYKLKNDKPEYQQVDFKPEFSKNLYFIYLGKKQDSSLSIKQYKTKIENNKHKSLLITALTLNIINSGSLDKFEYYINRHEKIMSEILNLPTIKSEKFNDFNGSVKSLGAWGGDFIMASSEDDFNNVKDYFKRKACPIIFSYDELVL